MDTMNALSDNPNTTITQNMTRRSRMEGNPYWIRIATPDPGAANLLLSSAVDEARRCGAAVTIDTKVQAPTGELVNVKIDAGQADGLADAATMFTRWADAADQPRLMHSPAEVASMLGVSARTLGEWRFTGDGPEFVKVGSVVRYPHDALTDWMAANRRATA